MLALARGFPLDIDPIERGELGKLVFTVERERSLWENVGNGEYAS